MPRNVNWPSVCTRRSPIAAANCCSMTANSAAAKFADADLLGMPWQIIVGRGASEGMIELKERKTGNRVTISVDEAIARFA